MEPSDHHRINTSQQKAKVLSSQYGQQFNLFTCDLQLYRVAVNIIWAYPEQFQDVILRLGGMHFLMSFLWSVGTLMANSWLEELLESTFSGVSKLLNGKKYPQNVRVLRIVTEEMLRNVSTENNV